MRFAGLVLALLLSVFASAARAADDAPYPMLDSGGHLGMVKGLIFTPDGKYLISGGADKVIRIWDWAEGRTVRTIRGQVGLGEEGAIYSLALSPDGKLLAVAGFMSPGFGVRPDEVGDIRLYDFATGKLLALLRGHSNVINALAFSPNGKLLVSGQDEELSAIIWDVERRQPLHRLKGHTDDVYAVAFTPDGERVVTASDDSTLRMWNVRNGALITEMKGHKGDLDRALAIRTSDGMIASGDLNGNIRLWDGKTGRFLRQLANQGSAVGPMRFSPDGKSLLTSCRRDCSSKWGGHVWDVATGKQVIHYGKHDNTVLGVAFSPDGRLAATAGGDREQIHIWDPKTGQTRQELVGVGDGNWAVAVSADGQRIAWGTTFDYTDHNDRGPLQMQLRLPGGSLGIGKPEPLDKADVKDFARAISVRGSYKLEHRSGGRPPRPDGMLDIKNGDKTEGSIERDSTSGLRHRSYTFTPDGKKVISGGASGEIRSFDLTGKRIAKFLGHDGEIWALTPAPDNKLLVTASGDQTIRFWNHDTAELIATFFNGKNGEWVMFTPQGYYASSPNGDSLVGWQINNGPSQAADYVTANQLRSHFFRPDIVERALILRSAKDAIGQSRNVNFALSDLGKRRPPAFEVLSPEAGSKARATPAEIRLQLEPNDDPVDSIEVLVNGRQATTPSQRGATARLAGTGQAERRFDVPLEQGENKIRIVARNSVGQTTRDLVLFHDKPGLLDARGSLYVLAIGVDKYARMPAACGTDGKQSCDLRYAGKDARAFRDTLVKQAAPLYKEIKTLLLTRDGDKPPTKANIEDALEEMLGKAGPEDTTVLFIAGHGVNDGRAAEYLFLPEDAEVSPNGFRRSTVLSWTAFQNALHNTQGRRLMFADTCHAGGAYNARLVNDAVNANIIVFSATDTQTFSWEFEHLGHGAFTYALIQGLEGKARRRDGSVTVFGLGEYISEEVASLTKDKQQPTFHISGAKNFMLARQ